MPQQKTHTHKTQKKTHTLSTPPPKKKPSWWLNQPIWKKYAKSNWIISGFAFRPSLFQGSKLQLHHPNLSTAIRSNDENHLKLKSVCFDGTVFNTYEKTGRRNFLIPVNTGGLLNEWMVNLWLISYNHPGTRMTRVLIGKGLVLGGWSPKIEDKQVPGFYKHSN